MPLCVSKRCDLRVCGSHVKFLWKGKLSVTKTLEPGWRPVHWQNVSDWIGRLPTPDATATQAAQDRQTHLLKPPGSLGRLEDLAIWLASWQGTRGPVADRVAIRIFAANHGVAAQGVSAYPPDVTAQMVAGFQAGFAAINQVTQVLGADLDVITLHDLGPTADTSQQPAMTQEQALDTFLAGLDAVPNDVDVLVLGEMGIGNTTTAAALYAALLKEDPVKWIGRGTGLDTMGVAHKVAIVAKILDQHGGLTKPLEVLRCVGGYEFVALVGALIAARLRRVPVVLDGFNVTAAAMVLWQLEAASLDHVIAGHVSAEKAHARALSHMELEPLLDLGMRLGEGSGAATAVPLLRIAAACHTGMATFAEAGVSGG